MTQHNTYLLTNSAATRLTEAGVHSGKDITLQNVNVSGYIYIGGEGVTTEDYGYRLAPNNAISFELSGEDSLYAIPDTNGLKLAVISINLEAGD